MSQITKARIPTTTTSGRGAQHHDTESDCIPSGYAEALGESVQLGTSRRSPPQPEQHELAGEVVVLDLLSCVPLGVQNGCQPFVIAPGHGIDLGDFERVTDATLHGQGACIDRGSKARSGLEVAKLHGDG